jgi:hypothetical protein
MPARVVAFEKIGEGCGEIDLESGRFMRAISPGKGRSFYGHGAFSRDGQWLYATQTVNATGEGCISVRDGRTYRYVGELPSHGSRPHDCALLADGLHMVIANGGGQAGSTDFASLVVVEIASGKLVHKVVLDDPEINAGHFDQMGDGLFAVVSAPRLGLANDARGGVSVITGDQFKRLHAADIAPRFIGEALSVVSSSQHIAVTHPLGGLLTVWDRATHTLSHTVDVAFARGIVRAVDGGYFVSYGQDSRLAFVADLAQPCPVDRAKGSFLTGSHLVNWSMESNFDRIRYNSGSMLQ